MTTPKPILKPVPRLLTALRKRTPCSACGEIFEQNASRERELCDGCKAVSTSKAGKR